MKKDTPKDVFDRLSRDDIEVNLLNHNYVWGVILNNNKYSINIKNNLSQDLVKYFIYLGTSYIMDNNLLDGVGVFFQFEYTNNDLLALETYIDSNLSVESLMKSVLFERKIKNVDFMKLLNTIKKI